MQELGQHLVAAEPARAEVTAEHAKHVVDVLDDDGLVKSQLRAQRGQIGLSSIHAQNQLGRIAGRSGKNDVDEERNPYHNRDQ